MKAWVYVSGGLSWVATGDRPEPPATPAGSGGKERHLLRAGPSFLCLCFTRHEIRANAIPKPPEAAMTFLSGQLANIIVYKHRLHYARYINGEDRK